MKLKKVLATMIAAAIAVSTMSSLAVSAADAPESVQFAGRDYTFEEIAEMSHLNPDKLQDFFMENPQEFYQSLTELVYGTSTASSTPDDSTGTNYSEFSELYAEGELGDILISGTNDTRILHVATYRHGHAALISDDSKIIHAPGPGMKSERAGLSRFGVKKRVRLYEVSGVEETQKADIHETAKSYIGWDYDFDASTSSKDSLNCATLVWRTYNDNEIELKKYFYTCRPKDIVEDPQTICVANLNWPGDGDSFNINE